jgi:tetratricopeptide (TPR) repeat protein
MPIGERLAEGVGSLGGRSYALLSDLQRLEIVRNANATEAVIFYGARILEALSGEALIRIGLTPTSSILNNLELLQQFGLIAAGPRYWAHGLRRLGNEVRHVLRQVTETDAHLAISFTTRYLTWFCCHFTFGPGLASVTADAAPLFHDPRDSLQGVMSECDSDAPRPHVLYELAGKSQELWDTPVIPALIAEVLLDDGKNDWAGEVLGRSHARFPEDLRLNQLRGLLLSRIGEVDRARGLLEPMYARFRGDPEVAGILAGVYKRLGRSSGNADWLRKSHQTYAAGWRESRQSSGYLGINAATSALLLGRTQIARQLAGQVRNLLEGRLKALASYMPDPLAKMSVWDRLTLAESHLLLGDRAAAAGHYRKALAQNASGQGVREVASGQAKAILSVLASREIAEAFVAEATGG